MRLLGYCTACRRFRYVRVSGHALALTAARAGVVEGVCSDCEESDRLASRPASRLVP